jgi:oligopeptide transport system permease protein
MTARELGIRLLLSVVVLWAVFTATFALTRLAPGNPFGHLGPQSPVASRNMERQHELDQSPLRQYGAQLSALLKGDLGTSLSFAPGARVSSVLWPRFLVSVRLGLWALLVAVVLGGGGGIWAGACLRSPVDRVLTVFFLVLASASVIVLGGTLRTLGTGAGSPFLSGGFQTWRHQVLPVLTLGLVYAAILFRLVRGGVAQQRSSKMLVALSGRGVSARRVLWRYVVPAALVPLLSYLGPFVAGMLTGSLVVERLFDVPGLAACFIQGAASRDYPLLMGAILVYTVLLVALNLGFEWVRRALDAREVAR